MPTATTFNLTKSPISTKTGPLEPARAPLSILTIHDLSNGLGTRRYRRLFFVDLLISRGGCFVHTVESAGDYRVLTPSLPNDKEQLSNLPPNPELSD